MKRSTERILTTHAGSFARPEGLKQLLLAKDTGKTVDSNELDLWIHSTSALNRTLPGPYRSNPTN